MFFFFFFFFFFSDLQNISSHTNLVAVAWWLVLPAMGRLLYDPVFIPFAQVLQN
jgi:hypothetical protein